MLLLMKKLLRYQVCLVPYSLCVPTSKVGTGTRVPVHLLLYIMMLCWFTVGTVSYIRYHYEVESIPSYDDQTMKSTLCYVRTKVVT